MPVTSTHHGLSIHTGAADKEDTDNRRLHRPLLVAAYINNAFNDATSGELYSQRAGHEGLDFYTVPTEVEAMYGGVVVKVVDKWKPGDGIGLGNHVTIRSCTDPDAGTGFEHTYAHMQEDAKMPEPASPNEEKEKGIVVEPGMTVRKGQKLGTSGGSGTYTVTGKPVNHLHVHVRAFAGNGLVTSEYEPLWKDNPEVGSSGKYEEEKTIPSQRIGGCLNFACFLPPDTAVPVLDKSASQLLSARDSSAEIPVHIEGTPAANGTPRPDTTTTDGSKKIRGRHLACYKVLGTFKESAESGGETWYRIQYAAETDTDPGTRWVPKTGTVSGVEDKDTNPVEWVQVEAVIPMEPGAPDNPHFVTTNGTTPAIRADPASTASGPTLMTLKKCYAVVGYWDDGQTDHHWWKIQYGTDEDDTGWVRGDEVWKYGDETGVPEYTGEAANPQLGGFDEDETLPGQVRDLVAWVPGNWGPEPVPTVNLRWKAPANGAAPTRYLIFRGTAENMADIFRVADVAVPATHYEDRPEVAVGTVVYYRVFANAGRGRTGLRSNLAKVVAGYGGSRSDQKQAYVEAPPTDASVTLVASAGGSEPVNGEVRRGNLYPIRDWIADTAGRWYQVLAQAVTGARGHARGIRAAEGGGGLVTGWVRASSVVLNGSLNTVSRQQYLRVSSWVTGLHLRTGPAKAFAAYRLLTNTHVWYAVVGQSNTNPVWYQIQYSTTFRGWVHGGYVTLSEAAPAVPTVSAPSAPEPGSSGEAAQGTSTVSGAASGPYRNLETNPEGRWSMTKTGTKVTANFASPRSPVQYYARQNPQPQFVLPVGFRPTALVPHEATGTHVYENGSEYPGSPVAKFDLTVGTNGELRYVNNSKVDHVGYLKYQVTGLEWQTAEAVAVPDAPTAPDIEAMGTYHNQQENRGSSWDMDRTGDAVSGTFTTTSSPVEYYANQNREALVWLPAEYWPERDRRFQVTGAVQVDRNGTAIANAPRVNFWITVRSRDGRMYYDRDAALTTAGVGYLSYSVAVSWDAAPRVTVPSVPRDLEVDDVEADEVELDWRSPADDGGDSVDEYKVEEYRNGRWREVEDDIARTGYDVEDLDAYTTYTFRVRARNSAGWSAPSTAVTVTTPRETPGEPGRPTAMATHERVTLTWTAPTSDGNVSGYRIERRVGNGSWERLVADTGEATPGWVDHTVAAATGYGYRVAASNYGVLGDWSSARSVTTAAAPTIPGQPTALTVSQGTDSRLQLNWTPPADTGGGITGYRIERSLDVLPRTWSEVVADTGAAAASWGDDVVAADTVYHYRASARNSAGVGMFSAEAQGRSRPQLWLRATASYPLTAHAEPRKDAAVTATFAIHLRGRVHDLVAQVPGTDGWWQVLIFGQTAQGPFWLPAAAGTATGDVASLPQPPGAPQAFTATLATSQVTLAWTAPAAGSAVTGYRLWRQVDNGAFGQLGSDLAATVFAHTDMTLQTGRIYRYWLQAQSAAGWGLPTATVAIAVMAMPKAPAAVTNVTATSAGAGTSLQLGWARAATGGLPAGYRVQWRVSGTMDDFVTETVAGTAHELTDLVPGTAYEIQVTAFNQEGDAPIASHTGTTVQVAPGMPEAVAVAVLGQDATATWAVPVTGGRPDAYHLQSKTQATMVWPTTHTVVTDTTHSLTGLGYEVAHDLRVRASNPAGQSAWVPVAFTTEALPRVSGAPTGLTATPSADSRMQLAWTAPADAGSPALTGYRIERAADARPRVWTVVAADTGSDAVTWDDAGLAAATVYRYRVSARNRTGTGPASAEAAGTTRPQATLSMTAAYPLTAHAWPAAAAPVTHTWRAHDAALKLDVAGRVGGPNGWWRVVRFGESAFGSYWLPVAAVEVTGATTAVPAAPGVPGTFASSAVTHNSATLTWTAPAGGGTVTGYRLWRRTGTEAWIALEAVLDAAVLKHTDTGLAAATVYQYRLQALSAAGAGVPTMAVEATTATEVTPLVREYGAGTHVLDFPAGYTTFYVQLCGGAGGGAGGQGEASNGADGGDGGCTFYATHRGGHVWTLEVGEGGAGGAYHERWAHDGRHGESSKLRRDGTLAATAARGARGESISHDGTDGATVGSSGGWGAAWPGNHRAPRGGRGGAGFREEAGRAGADGMARVLFTGTPSDRLPIMPTELVVAPGREGRLRLTWEEEATVGPATSYRIERSADVDPLVWTEVEANTGMAERVWHDSDLAADTVYHYRVTGRNGAGLGTPSLAASGRTRPQATLLAAAAYPLTAHAWPAATAPTTHTWAIHDAEVKLDVAGQAGGPDGWYRVLRFGAGDADAYWLPAAAVHVTGAATGVPEVPGIPGNLAVAEVTDTTATLTWTVPVTGGTVTGYRLWRQTESGAFAPAGETLAAETLTHTDTGLTLSTGYRYRLQALSAGGPGIPATVGAITGAVPPLIRNYDDGTHTLTVPAGYDTLYAQLCGGGGGADRHNGEDGGRGGATYHTAGVTVGDVLRFVIGEGGDGGEGGSRAEDGEDGEVSYLRINRREVAIGKHGRGGEADTSGYPNLDGPIRGSSGGWPASWPGDARRPAGGALGFTNHRGGDGRDGEDGLARVLLMPTAPPVVPGPPTDLMVAPSADSRMALSWTAPATGAAVAGYRIERALDAAPLDWTVMAEDTGNADATWDDRDLDGDTVYHYRVTARSVVALGTPSMPASGRTRPQLVLSAMAAYPLAARAWPLATAPATHTWAAYDASVPLDVAARDADGSWYRVLRFGERIRNAYWLPAAAVTVTGATADLPQAPGAPGDPAPPAATHDTVTLTWTAPTTGGTVTGYRVWRQTGEEAFTVPGADLAADVLTHTDTAVAESTAYQYRVQALSAAGAGVRTPAVAVTTAATPREPGVPTAVAAAPGDDSPMVLTWTAPADAGTQPIAGYRIERAADAPTPDWVAVAAATGTTDTTWSDRGLAADTVYHYRVRARNRVGPGDPSAAAKARTRPQLALKADATYPLQARAWPAADAPVSHTWSAHDATVSLDIAGQGAGGGGWYRGLRFGQAAGGPYWLPAGAVTVTGATTAVPQAPGAPGDFRTTDLQGRVALAWRAPMTGGTVTGYRLWRQTGAAAWAMLAEALDAATLTHTDTAVSAGTTYRYRLQAQSGAGYGVRTTAVDAAVTAPPSPPVAPAHVGAAQVAATTAQLFWDPVAEATGHDIEMRQSWYAADHAAARVRLPVSGTFTLQTGTTTTTTVTVTRTGTLVELTGLPAGYTHWDLYVRAVNAGGASAWVEASVYNDPAHLYPRQPTGLRGRRTATGTATLGWNAVTGAADYRVHFDFPADDQGPAGWDWLPYRDVAVTVSGTTATVSGLPATAAHWGLRVSALNANGDESVRSTALAVSTATAPAAPTALRAAPGADSPMQLSWTAPADAGSQPVTGYRIERSADMNPRVWTEAAADTASTATTWVDSNLAAATAYHYRVSARNSVGTGPPSGEAEGTTRPQAALSAAAGYPLAARRWPATTAPASHTWSAHDAAVRLDVAGRVRGTPGWWRVLRFGHSADGPYWLPATAVTVAGATADVPEVPGTPTALTAAPGDGSSMQLSWTAAAAGGAATGYRIERSPDATPRVWTEVVADTGTTDTSWSDSGLAAATTYHYRVAGRNAAGPGMPSAVAAGTTRPQLTLRAAATYPLTAHAWPLAAAPVTHSWAAYDAALQLEVLAQGAGGGGWYRVLRPGAGGGPFWLPAGAVSLTGTAADLPQAPGIPGDFRLPAATHDTVTLTWTAPAAGGTVTGYRLWRQTGEEAFAVLGTDLAADIFTHTDTTVVAATAYQYRVQALAAAGAGVRNAAVAVTTAEPPRVPWEPTGLEAAPGADSQMQLTWEAPADAGTQPIGGYRVERSADVWPRVWTDAAADTGTADTTWRDGGLAPATTYHYRVRARTRAGTGLPSGETPGTTRPQAALPAAATYPLTAHRWPAATAPASHTWSAHDAMVRLDVAFQGPGGGGWYRVLRFGKSAAGPYWLPAAAVRITGATTDVPQAPGAPEALQATDTQGRVVLTWNTPATGGAVTGYRLWRQTGEAAWAVLTDALDAYAWTYTDSAVTTGATYQYRLQAQAQAGYGPRTAVLGATVTPPPPPDPTYFGAAQTAATTVDLAWDAVPGATGYDVEIQQSHGASYVLLPQAGTFSLRTGPATTDTVTATVVRTGTALRLTGLPAGYAGWSLFLRAVNAGGASNWLSAYVSNHPRQLAPAPPTGLTGRRTAAGLAALGWTAVTGATAYRVHFDFPADNRGAAGWHGLPDRGVTVTVTGTAATVGGLPAGAAHWSFRVSALNGGRESLVSSAVTVANTTT